YWPLIVINHSEPWQEGMGEGERNQPQTLCQDSEECSHLSGKEKGRKSTQRCLDGLGVTATK
ncbi:hypothetical protein E2320_021017, partial [Naja naja]